MSGDRAPRVRARRAGLAGCIALLTAALTVIVTGYSGAWAAFTATTASTGSQLMTRAAFPDYRTAVTESGAVVYHPFDDVYGSATAAAVAGTTPGIYNGGGVPVSVSPGAIAASTRKAVTFPTNSYAAANSSSTLAGTVTLEAWVKTGQGGAVVSLLPDDASTTAGRIQLYVNARGEACVGLILQSGASQEVCGSDASDTKVWTAADQTSPVWHHIAVAIDPSGLADTPGSTDGTQVNVYVDGGIVFARGLAGTWPSAVTGRVRAGSAAITTDVGANGPAPDAWSGDIDEVAVYAGALSATELKQHYDESKDVSASTPLTYGQSVRASSPHLYWQLEDTPGAATRTVADNSTNGRTGTFYSAFDWEVTGAPTGTAPVGSTPGRAVRLNGLSDISTGASRTTPAEFSTEVWFNSTGGTGPLISFGDTQTGPSTIPYGAVYLTAQGTLAFSLRAPQRTVLSGQDYRNTGPHLVTATMGDWGRRMRLYVDGVMVGENTSTTPTGSLTGFWRWGGGGDYSAYTTKPGAAFFTGVLDEASVYDRELTAEDVAIHWGARL